MEPFYRDRIVYQIYPRSFRDSNGDGFGDLNGIREKLLYLHALGVGLLWLSPIYPSPDRDNGYDIADYTAIDPRYGTMAEFDALLSEAKALDIGIVMDLVINHTSDRHSWFQKSMAGEAPYRDYYIWRAQKGVQRDGIVRRRRLQTRVDHRRQKVPSAVFLVGGKGKAHLRQQEQVAADRLAFRHHAVIGF